MIEHPACKFRDQIDSYCNQIATKDRDAVQKTGDLIACNTECKVARHALHCEIIHAGQTLDPATGGQCVLDEIHRPGQVRRIRAQKGKSLGRQPLRRGLRFIQAVSDKSGIPACS